MNRYLLILSATLMALFAGASTVSAETIDGKRILQSSTEGAIDGGVDGAIRGTFSELERQVIGDYFKQHRYYGNDEDSEQSGKKAKKDKGKEKQKGLPPGLAKREHLPPGLQKQLERNGSLPPGLAKRELPADLTSRLPPAEDGMERVIADTSVILMDKATGVIKDIIRDIIQ